MRTASWDDHIAGVGLSEDSIMVKKKKRKKNLTTSQLIGCESENDNSVVINVELNRPSSNTSSGGIITTSV